MCKNNVLLWLNKIILPPFWKRDNSKRKIFAPLVSVWCAEVTNVEFRVEMTENLSNLTRPLKPDCRSTGSQ